MCSLTPVHQPWWDSTCSWPVFRCYFCLRHIFSVVSTAILSIFFNLSTVSTFVLSNTAKTLIRVLIKCFLSVSSLIKSSRSFCSLLVTPSTMLKSPSSPSLSTCSSSRYSSNSCDILSKIKGVSGIS